MALWMISAPSAPPSPCDARARLGADSDNMGICRPIADQTRPLFCRTLLRPPIGTADWRLPNAATAAPDPGPRPGRAGRLRCSIVVLSAFRLVYFSGPSTLIGGKTMRAWILHCNPHLMMSKRHLGPMWESPNLPVSRCLSLHGALPLDFGSSGDIRPPT